MMKCFVFGSLLVIGAVLPVHAGMEASPTRFGSFNRAGALEGAPFNSFAYEMKRLGGTRQLFPAREAQPDQEELAFDPGLPADMAARVDAAFGTGGHQPRLGEALVGLPVDVQGYVEGALAWHTAKARCTVITNAWEAESRTLPMCTELDARALSVAHAAFTRVVALPDSASSLRGAWAAYMLGQVESHLAEQTLLTSDFEEHRKAAIAAFIETRRRVVAGARDTEGLASASLGDEARMHMYTNYAACDWLPIRQGHPCIENMEPAELKEAMRLYVEQVAGGSYRGLNSLSTVAGAVLRVPKMADTLTRDPFMQSILTPYVLGVVSVHNDEGEVDARLANYLEAIRKLDISSRSPMAGLAALLFRQGKYEEAEELVQRDDRPMAHWVRAKLALRKGDQGTALHEFALAVTSAGSNAKEELIEDTNVRRIRGEKAILVLSRGEYMEAMEQAYALADEEPAKRDPFFLEYGDFTDNWATAGEVSASGLVMYLAERVLSLDELVAFVHRHELLPGRASAYTSASYIDLHLAEHVRWLLARRLFRAGRYDEGLPYFPAQAGSYSDDIYPAKFADEYVALLKAAAAASSPLEKAKHVFDAAVMERKRGMELIGYYGAPDFAVSSGSYSDADVPWDTWGAGAGKYVSDIEKTEFEKTAAHPKRRFHYRYLAADRAVVTAALLPSGSQAYGAALCFAARWMRDGPADDLDPRDAPGGRTEAERRIDAYRDRYADASGTPLSRLGRFGSQCDEPDFAALAETVGAPVHREASAE